jgi:hypothetical protein
MILVPTTVENDLSHAFGQSTLSQHFAYQMGLSRLVQALNLLSHHSL